MTEEGYAEVDGAAYERLRKSLLREKGGDRQREFLAAARSSERFLVRLNKGYWERLTTLIVSRNSVFGSNVVQDALVAALAKFLESEPESPLRTQQQLGAALRRIRAVTAGRELRVLDFSELVDLTSELLVEQHRVSIAQGYCR